MDTVLTTHLETMGGGKGSILFMHLKVIRSKMPRKVAACPKNLMEGYSKTWFNSLHMRTHLPGAAAVADMTGQSV